MPSQSVADSFDDKNVMVWLALGTDRARFSVKLLLGHVKESVA